MRYGLCHLPICRKQLSLSTRHSCICSFTHKSRILLHDSLANVSIRSENSTEHRIRELARSRLPVPSCYFGGRETKSVANRIHNSECCSIGWKSVLNRYFLRRRFKYIFSNVSTRFINHGKGYFVIDLSFDTRSSPHMHRVRGTWWLILIMVNVLKGVLIEW